MGGMGMRRMCGHVHYRREVEMRWGLRCRHVARSGRHAAVSEGGGVERGERAQACGMTCNTTGGAGKEGLPDGTMSHASGEVPRIAVTQCLKCRAF